MFTMKKGAAGTSVLLLGLVAALGMAAAVPGSGSGVLPEAVPATPPQVAEGQAVFQGKGNCFTCHGKDAKGTVLAPDLTDGAWLNFPQRPTLDEAKALVTKGVPKPKKHPAPMPPMGGAKLSPEDLTRVVEYVLSLTAS
jgi:mono/diheme cytochrome c family protein